MHGGNYERLTPCAAGVSRQLEKREADRTWVPSGCGTPEGRKAVRPGDCERRMYYRGSWVPRAAVSNGRSIERDGKSQGLEFQEVVRCTAPEGEGGYGLAIGERFF